MGLDAQPPCLSPFSYFKKYLLIATPGPGTVLGRMAYVTNKTDTLLTLMTQKNLTDYTSLPVFLLVFSLFGHYSIR